MVEWQIPPVNAEEFVIDFVVLLIWIVVEIRICLHSGQRLPQSWHGAPMMDGRNVLFGWVCCVDFWSPS